MARLLKIEQTKSRPRHSNDNGLVESKNGAMIRKHIGWGHIASQHAAAVDRFHREFLNPYLNFHRPCGIAEIVCTAKGKLKRIYRRWATPWEILRELPDCADFLRPGLSVAGLDERAAAQTDTEAARDLQEAKRQLWAAIRRRSV